MKSLLSPIFVEMREEKREKKGFTQQRLNTVSVQETKWAASHATSFFFSFSCCWFCFLIACMHPHTAAFGSDKERNHYGHFEKLHCRCTEGILCRTWLTFRCENPRSKSWRIAPDKFLLSPLRHASCPLRGRRAEGLDQHSGCRQAHWLEQKLNFSASNPLFWCYGPLKISILL